MVKSELPTTAASAQPGKAACKKAGAKPKSSSKPPPLAPAKPWQSQPQPPPATSKSAGGKARSAAKPLAKAAMHVAAVEAKPQQPRPARSRSRSKHPKASREEAPKAAPAVPTETVEPAPAASTAQEPSAQCGSGGGEVPVGAVAPITPEAKKPSATSPAQGVEILPDGICSQEAAADEELREACQQEKREEVAFEQAAAADVPAPATSTATEPPAQADPRGGDQISGSGEPALDCATDDEQDILDVAAWIYDTAPAQHAAGQPQADAVLTPAASAENAFVAAPCDAKGRAPDSDI